MEIEHGNGIATLTEGCCGVAGRNMSADLTRDRSQFCATIPHNSQRNIRSPRSQINPLHENSRFALSHCFTIGAIREMKGGGRRGDRGLRDTTIAITMTTVTMMTVLVYGENPLHTQLFRLRASGSANLPQLQVRKRILPMTDVKLDLLYAQPPSITPTERSTRYRARANDHESARATITKHINRIESKKYLGRCK